MLERFTIPARQIIFFARLKAGALGSDCIGTDHLLFGMLQADPALIVRVCGGEGEQLIREAEKSQAAVGQPIPQDADMNLCEEGIAALSYVAKEAERLHRRIETHHVLLGLIQNEASRASLLLTKGGLSLDQIRSRATEPLP